MTHCDESELKEFESKIDDVLKILHEMTAGNNASPEDIEYKNKCLKSEPLSEDEFIVKVRDDRTIINKDEKESTPKQPESVDQFTFMRQMEQDAEKRAENRRNRETIAENFRRLGNDAFRNEKYEEAISLYTKGVDHVKDSPILYNNRALSYIKLKLYKRALIDCDYVINRLDEKNLRSWLYRAVAYYNLNDTLNFEKSVKMAKKNNANEIQYIEKFINTMKNL